MQRFALRWQCIMLALVPSLAQADITGFNNLDPSLWSPIHQGDGGSSPSYNSATDTLQMTTTTVSENRSLWYLTPQPISDFTASFTYTANNQRTDFPYGACFVIQNSPAGTNALGTSGGGMGYGTISKSIALSFEIAGAPTHTGLYKNGSVASSGVSTSPVNLFSGNPISVAITYHNSLLTLTLTDTVTQAPFSTSYPALDIPTLVGGSTAYVGFTASTDNLDLGWANQYFGSPHFAGVPEPATASLALLLGALIRRR